MRKVLIAFTAVLLFTLIVRAQPRDVDCNPIPVPASCANNSQSVRTLEDRIARLQERLKNASPAAKPDLLRTISRLNAELETAEAALSRCIREQGPPQRQLAANEVIGHVVGKAILETTNDNAPGPYTVDVDIDVRFSRNRCEIVVTRFPTITTKTDKITGVGRVTVEITKTGAATGVFHPVSGRMALSINLHFHYETKWASDDDAHFRLSTEDSITRIDGTVEAGSALDAEGNIKVMGSGRFLHGFLAGATGRLMITATIFPRPN